MSYVAYTHRAIVVTGLVLTGSTPVDIATGYLPYAGHFTMNNVWMSVVAGTGIGTTATFTFNTGSAGIGSLLSGASLQPLNLITPSGVNMFPAFLPTSYMTMSRVVVRQTANANATGNIAFQLQVIPLS